jgi:hypothetical protein
MVNILFPHDSSLENNPVCPQTAIRILQELLRELVHDAHTLGLKVVLDVLLGLVGKDGAWTRLGRIGMVGLDSDFGDFPNKVQTIGVFPVVYLSTCPCFDTS